MRDNYEKKDDNLYYLSPCDDCMYRLSGEKCASCKHYGPTRLVYAYPNMTDGSSKRMT